ncbi:AAA family ATPase [Thermoflexibacter ruber]|uniref:Predicted ATPase n=1 Tax=Thermoflexibacter ruber TaxID=1003 RepID=A0A1I2GAF5_9BACT|nr:ATP-binding protein [Thermoflexibacter ruber]SFF14119.1 Predicted ATPase [Thermoflexibacter ruber]
MITKIKIDGFKSFQNFEMEFTPLTIIAGINASGKSNLFDALMLLSRLAESDNLKKAFKEQRGEFIELFTQYAENEYAKVMSFEIEMLVNRTVKDDWGNQKDLKYTRLRYRLKIKRFTNDIGIEDLAVMEEHLENLKHSDDRWIQCIPKDSLDFWRPKVSAGKRGTPYINTEIENNIPTVLVPQDGVQGGNKRRFPLINANKTVLSSFDTVDFPHVLAAKEEMRSWKFLQLNPEELRKPTNKDKGEDKLTTNGGNLAATLFRIKQENEYSLKEISRKLNSFLPNFIEVSVVDDKENKQYIIKLKDSEKNEYSSRVLSEGTLRILALCILEYDSKHTGLLCFEEPENGIHPFRISTMAKLLKDLSTDFSNRTMPLRQVIVNTHSPKLVENIYHWSEDRNVSIWFSQMRSKVVDLDAKRIKLNATKITPIPKNNQLSMEYSEQDKKLSLAMVKKYLEQDEIAPKSYE